MQCVMSNNFISLIIVLVILLVIALHVCDSLAKTF